MTNLGNLLSSIILFAVCISTSVNAQTTPAKWTRTTLTGTGLSVESPVPYKLDHDKPGPFLDHLVAAVRWSLSFQGVYSTIDYEEARSNKKTPRQQVDYIANLFSDGVPTKYTRVTDITYFGSPAAKLEQGTYNSREKQDVHRTYVVFGTLGKLTTVNIVYPVNNAAAKAIAERIFASVSKAGAVAPAVSKEPPTDWKTMRYAGLRFDTPNSTQDPQCRKNLPAGIGYVTSEFCYRWGTDFSLKIVRKQYSVKSLTPSPSTHANNTMAGLKRLDAESKLNAGHEYSVKAFQLPGAEAARLDEFMSVGTVGNQTYTVYARKGSEFWEIRINFPLRWDFHQQAADRILKSLSFAPAAAKAPPAAQKPQSGSKTDHYTNGKHLYDSGDPRAAIAELTSALSENPNSGLAYFYRGLSKYTLMEFDGAISDFSEVIRLKTNLTEAYFNRGTAYLDIDKFNDAISDFTRSISNDAKFYRSYYNRGLAYYQLNNYNKALVDLSSTIRLNPKHANAYELRSRIYCKQKRILSAVSDENSAIALGTKISKRCGQ